MRRPAWIASGEPVPYLRASRSDSRLRRTDWTTASSSAWARMPIWARRLTFPASWTRSAAWSGEIGRGSGLVSAIGAPEALVGSVGYAHELGSPLIGLGEEPLEGQTPRLVAG